MDSIRVSEAPDTGSIPVEATSQILSGKALICPQKRALLLNHDIDV
jgi:hypothetical protein